jgi:flagellar hook-associated protein 2
VTTSGSKVTSSILSGNRELSDIARKLRTELYTSSGLTGTVNRLSDLGVTSSGIQNTVSFNSSVLEAKLASASDDVNAFFKDTGTSAFITRIKTNFLDKMITDAGSATGGLQAQLTNFTKQNTSLDKQIEDVERRLTAQRSTLEASFIAMEKSQSRYQQQGSYLAKTFANGN